MPRNPFIALLNVNSQTNVISFLKVIMQFLTYILDLSLYQFRWEMFPARNLKFWVKLFYKVLIKFWLSTVEHGSRSPAIYLISESVTSFCFGSFNWYFWLPVGFTKFAKVDYSSGSGFLYSRYTFLWFL